MKKKSTRLKHFWDLYNKKRDRPVCERKWARLSETTKQKIMDYLPAYIKDTPDKTFRKDPKTFFESGGMEQ